MDFPSSLKKSFRNHGSHKHSRRISIEKQEDPHHEEKPILSDHNRESKTASTSSSPSLSPSPSSNQHLSPRMTTSSVDLGDRHEVIVKIDGGDQTMERDVEWNVNSSNCSMSPHVVQDPPLKLIGNFLNKQKAAGLEMSLDMDLEMDEWRSGAGAGGYHHDNSGPAIPHFPPLDSKNVNNNNERVSTSKDLRVSFQAPPTNSKVVDIVPDEKHPCRKQDEASSDEDYGTKRVHGRRRSNVDDNGNGAAEVDQVLRCTSFQRRSSGLGRLKTKSRLIDSSPERPEKRSGRIAKSGILKSGMLGGGRASGMLGKPVMLDEEEDDPLFDEDLPEEYRKGKLNALILAQWISLVLIVTALAVTLAIRKWKKRKLRGLQLWKWEVLVLVLICGRLVSGWAIRIVVVFIERNFLLRKRVLYFVYGVRKAVQNCFWLGLVLIAWHSMFDKKVEGNNKFLQYVNKLMICMLVATLLWLVKTLMVKVLASSFHVSTFFDRIQDSLFNQYVIETLSGPPLIEIQSNQDEEERTMAEVWKLQNAGATLPPELRPPGLDLNSKSGKGMGSGRLARKASRTRSFKISGPIPKNQGDAGITIDHLHRLNTKNVSAWNMKRLMKIVRHGVLSTLDEQIMDTTQHDESTTQIRSEFEAKVAARKIFRNVAKPRAKFIDLEDLMRFLREDEAIKTMTTVEGSSESDKISKASLKSWVVNVFRERRALALTLNDTKTAVNKLHQMVNVLVGITIVVICLVLLEIATSKFLLFVSSQIVVVAFIFGNTCKTIFESIIFVFVMHPFDVGDRCEIEGVQMIVEEMNILTTIFLRFDNQKIMYPNSTLSTKPIHNYYRSPDMGDSVEFCVHVATPEDKIQIMKQRIVSYIDNKKDHWYSSAVVVTMNIEDLHRMKLAVWMRHRMNHQDMGERWLRRALLVEEMIKIFKELDIEYRLYPIDINIRSMPPPVSSNRVPSTWTTSSN